MSSPKRPAYTRTEAETLLYETFGFRHFHHDQWNVIERLLRKERVLMIHRTGFGKSLCYQFPALLWPGVTIVFSPLIALMEDQVGKLQRWGIAAGCLNHRRSDRYHNTLHEAIGGELRLLFVSPQRMEDPEFLNACQKMEISMVVVDEAHCISVWGHDFIPAYRKIVNLIRLMPRRFPILATTATATPRVEADIRKQLGEELTPVRGPLMRRNLGLWVIEARSQEEKMIWLGRNLPRLEGTGILYTGTRADAEYYTEWLSHLDLQVVFYHAGVSSEQRIEIEAGLMENRYKCVVSTNALGMGLDKPDLRFIIHTHIPQSPIHYYQELGRCGRDGKPAHVVLLYQAGEDEKLPRHFIENNRPAVSTYHRVIRILKKQRCRLGELMREANLSQQSAKVVLADLIDQGIVAAIRDRKSTIYEYRYGAAELDTQAFERLRDQKEAELDAMLNYVSHTGCRMQYLCTYLGDPPARLCGRCDNDRQQHYTVQTPDDWIHRVHQFRNSHFPPLTVKSPDPTRSRLENGVAAALYGHTDIGNLIHRCKYGQGGPFPESLVKLTIRAFHHCLNNRPYDLVIYIPPTESGTLVEQFAQQVAHRLNLPLSHGLTKTRKTDPQKVFQNHLLKKDNLKDAFVFHPENEIRGKTVLLLDDIYDSGATIKEVGRYLTQAGAATIVPLVIAKTVARMD